MCIYVYIYIYICIYIYTPSSRDLKDPPTWKTRLRGQHTDIQCECAHHTLGHVGVASVSRIDLSQVGSIKS